MKTKSNGGFTILELMIAVTIISVLVAISIPSYRSFVLKAKLSEAAALLSDLRLREDQHYADNLKYVNGIVPDSPGNYFTNAQCVTSNVDQDYTCTATSPSLGFSLTINQVGERTTNRPDGSTVACWVLGEVGAC